MIRAGLIWNQHSHRNRGAGRAPLPEDVIDIVPEEPSHLMAGLRRLAADGVELVVIDGGDGTVREVLTRLPEAFEGRMPRLAVLPNGKTNALALDIETPLGTTLEEILVSAEARKPTKRRQCLEVVRAGETAPERRGFLFGVGAFVRATKLAQKNHGRGFFDDAAVSMTLMGGLARTVLGGSGDRWRKGEPASLSISGTPEERRWFMVMASTFKRFPLGFMPYGEPREGLKVLSVEAPPRRLLRALPKIIRGVETEWLAANGYHRDDTSSFQISFEGDFVLDGEPYRGGDMTVRQGPSLEFVIP
ncbi:MAG: diacylglycerol kinase [Alphaproteobacteria bacterium]|nr:diacylglycerol kinase [Alphaproteobacteria bacterium]MBU1516944.1 diacylglycerol kinase [Alphaproteobacteria bacterium]MBU2095832.1 diacylglycerol kinase [Alphaproteobacteria bacterium]MBU2152031.1 diacylglycerol kinase [Alphaproteobacteria bacterium]MBU2309552.1 diacylglycerol kinase [Alphaproteobacteria bacterium]